MREVDDTKSAKKVQALRTNVMRERTPDPKVRWLYGRIGREVAPDGERLYVVVGCVVSRA